MTALNVSTKGVDGRFGESALGGRSAHLLTGLALGQAGRDRGQVWSMHNEYRYRTTARQPAGRNRNSHSTPISCGTSHWNTSYIKVMGSRCTTFMVHASIGTTAGSIRAIHGDIPCGRKSLRVVDFYFYLDLKPKILITREKMIHVSSVRADRNVVLHDT